MHLAPKNQRNLERTFIVQCIELSVYKLTSMVSELQARNYYCLVFQGLLPRDYYIHSSVSN